MSLAIYLVEAGLVLAIAPWTELWQRNYFVARWPWLGSWMHAPTVQGLVIGVGVITAVAGMADLRSALANRLTRPAPGSDRTAADGPGSPAP